VKLLRLSYSDKIGNIRSQMRDGPSSNFPVRPEPVERPSFFFLK